MDALGVGSARTSGNKIRESHMGKKAKKPVVILKPKGRGSRSAKEITRAIKKVMAERTQSEQQSVLNDKK
jgi:glucose-6-phosphate 1-dehydrogenase